MEGHPWEDREEQGGRGEHWNKSARGTSQGPSRGLCPDSGTWGEEAGVGKGAGARGRG